MVELKPLHSPQRLVDQAAAEKGNAEPHRPHMGASVIGKPCKRKTWLNFRWFNKEKFDGRLHRLFNRGKDFEPVIIGQLRDAGYTVLGEADDHGQVFSGALPNSVIIDPDGQLRIRLGSHVSGSLDGFIKGLHQAPEKWHVMECKTHSDKSFKAVVKNGVKHEKREHWVQMQIYMIGTGLDRALYVALNKNNEELYFERVRLEKREAKRLIAEAQSLALLQRMPEPLSADPSYYICKWCHLHAFCHEGAPMAEKNCRTCAFSIPNEHNEFVCAKYSNQAIPLEFQRQGCDQYQIHDDMKGKY